MRVAVLGARGQLGAAVVDEFSSGHEVAAFVRESLDVADFGRVLAALGAARPDVVINCTGFNAVDAAEERPVEAFQTNSLALRTLARAATATGAALVHYSSDFVFGGDATEPYSEDDRPDPRSAYAASKLIGEWLALDAPRAYVLRVESLFGRGRSGAPAKGSVARIVERLESGERQPVFGDRTITPTYVIDAAAATRALVERGAPAGVYHCVNSGTCTWADLAREAARLLNVDPAFDVVNAADVPMRAARPKYSALSNKKLLSVGVRMPSWQDALGRYISALQKAKC